MNTTNKKNAYQEYSSEDEENECANCFAHKQQKLSKVNSSEETEWTYFLRACRQSSIHGVKHIGDEGQSTAGRILWLLCIFSASCYTVYLILDIIVDPMESNPVIMAFENKDITIDKIPYPAITICNTNKRKLEPSKSLFANVTQAAVLNQLGFTINKTEVGWMYYALHYILNICKSTNSFTESVYPENITNLHSLGLRPVHVPEGTDFRHIWYYAKNSFHECRDMVVLCLWKNVPLNCAEHFKPIYTESGYCCSFNMMPTYVLRKQTEQNRYMGSNANLELLYKWGNWNIDNDIVESDSEETEESHVHSHLFDRRPKLDIPKHQKKAGQSSGLTLLLNPEIEHSDPSCRSIDSVGFKIQVHSSIVYPHVSDFGNTIEINTETFLKIEAQIQTTDPQVSDISKEKRHCYFLGEFNLGHFSFYTQRNCLDECESKLVNDACGCILSYMPRTNESRCITNEEFNCVRNYKSEIKKDGISNMCNHCWPSCTQLEYHAETSSFPLRDDVDLWINKTTSSPQWKEKSLSVVHVFFAKDTVDSKVRKILYDYQDLLANAGGFLGLTLGVSMLSIVEILYFLLRRLILSFLFEPNEQQNEQQIKRKASPSPIQRNLIQKKAVIKPPQYKVKQLSVISQSYISGIYADEPIRIRQTKKVISMDWFYR